MIKVFKTKLEGVLLVEPETFEDFRGHYVETYNEAVYRQHGIRAKFVQDDFSVSGKNVLRGIHADPKIEKLISCPRGRFYLVVVNCDEKSKNFGQWESFVLSAANRLQVFAPSNHGVAHLVLSEEAIFNYKQSGYYNPKRQKTYKWNDPKFSIWWPIKNPILSRRDEAGHYV